GTAARRCANGGAGGIPSAASSQTAKTEAGGGGNPEGTDAVAGDAELLRGRGSAAGQAGAGLDEN
ncbi:hypothetical protein RFX70_21485, partial [Acinetobacter baumannii]|nr:hypothetical protein [Acinetobacter baumannii]